jgi:hypothetical protein
MRLRALRPTVVRTGQSPAKRFRSLSRQERVERVAAPKDKFKRRVRKQASAVLYTIMSIIYTRVLDISLGRYTNIVLLLMMNTITTNLPRVGARECGIQAISGAYRFNGVFVVTRPPSFGQPRSQDRGKGSAGANLGRRVTLISTRGKGFQNAFARNLSTRCPSQR